MDKGTGTTVATAYIQVEPTTQNIKDKLTKQMEPDAKSTGTIMGTAIGSGIGNGVSDLAMKALDKAVDLAKAASDKIREALQTTITQGSRNEQAVGGIETLFKDSADTVRQYASNAYKDAGVSANTYMEQVTSFAASLVQSLGGDTSKAADLANTAIVDMSDNANKMGTDIGSIQWAYQGFAKQNYTMLDNLKLGYGGTKSEMQRLIDTANELNKEQGKNTQYSIDSYADVVSAIHDVQENLGITGTTAEEAATTISGSMGMAKASFEDLMTAMASGGDVKAALENAGDSVSTYVQNAMSMIGEIIQSIPEIITELASDGGILDSILNMINGIDWDQVTEDIKTIMQTIMDSGIIPKLGEIATQLINNLGDIMTELQPTILELTGQILLAILETLGETTLHNLMNIGSDVLDLLGGVWDSITDTFYGFGRDKLGPWLIDVGKTITDKVRGIWRDVAGFFASIPEKMAGIGRNIIGGLRRGVAEAWNNFTSWLNGLISGIPEIAKKVLKIGSPSKVFANEVGRWIPAGIAEGIKGSSGLIDNALEDATLNPQVNADILSGVRGSAASYQTTNTSYGGTTLNVYGGANASAQDIADDVLRVLDRRTRSRRMVLA